MCSQSHTTNMKTLTAYRPLRKIFISGFLLISMTSFATANVKDVRDSIDNIFFKRQLFRVQQNSAGINFYDDDDHDRWVKKLLIKGSWRWDLDEFYLMLEGFGPLCPEYYFDDELKASNGGWLLA